MKEVIYEIIENAEIAPAVFEMRLRGDVSAFFKAGQFIDIRIPGKYLRRPISVCDYDDDGLTIVYKVVGEGTRALSEMKAGGKINALAGLGNGFDENVAAENIALIGGGIGLPPLYNLAKRLKANGKRVTVIAGFNTAREAYYLDKFGAIADVKVATADGTLGTKGFVTAVFDRREYDYFYACGPEPMLAALVATGADGQLSYEARMGCGFGACMGCSCKTRLGAKRICKDGPVMTAEEMR